MNSRKRILLCNDDGFDADGICALEETLADWAEVWKIAPDCQRSGHSHAMSFHDDLHLIQVSEKRFKVKNGYPADCANIGFYTDGFPDFDLVIGGINHGPNLGDDVHYSGTVAIARQAAIHHTCGIAISATDFEASPKQMLRIGDWLCSWLRQHIDHLQTRIVYNINYPKESKLAKTSKDNNNHSKNHLYPNICFSRQGKRIYKDRYVELENNNNHHGDDSHHTRRLRLSSYPQSSEECTQIELSDLQAILDGYISITPLSTYTTHNAELDRWIQIQKNKKIIHS